MKVGEDEGHRQMDELEKITQKQTEAIDDLMVKKEEEVMSI